MAEMVNYLISPSISIYFQYDCIFNISISISHNGISNSLSAPKQDKIITLEKIINKFMSTIFFYPK